MSGPSARASSSITTLSRINSDVRINGVFLKEGEQVGDVDPDTGSRDSSTCSRTSASSTAADIERKITVPDSNRHILEEIKRYADEHEAKYGRFPKTLIFAANDLPHTSHADQLVELCAGRFRPRRDLRAQDHRQPTVDRPLQRIREFRNRPNPGDRRLASTMLTTGVDIPDLEFIVFLRPVKSPHPVRADARARHPQGRDTFPDKSHFVVFDCFDGTLLEYFRNATAITTEPPDKPPDHSGDHRRHLEQPRPRLQRPLPGEAAAAHRQGDVGRGPRIVRPLHPETATSASSPRTCPP